MSFLFVYYGYLDTSGRAKELINTFSNNNNLLIFTSTNSGLISIVNRILKKKYHRSKLLYLPFFLEGFYFALKNKKKVDGLIISDGGASILGVFLVKTILRNRILIHDFAEFYETDNYRIFSFNRLVLLFERLLVSHASLVICANQQRSELMQNYYNLTSPPHVFENIWSLSNEQNIQTSRCKEKEFELNEKLKLIYTGSINLEVQFINLLNAVKENENICHLSIAGYAKTETIEALKIYIDKNNINNFSYLGSLSHEELLLELRTSHIGFIFYPLDTNNNIYCAPGKLHEYIFECLPIITSSNPSLKDFTKLYGLGISDDDFSNAITKLSSNYKKHKSKLRIYLSNNPNLIMNNRLRLRVLVDDIIKKANKI